MLKGKLRGMHASFLILLAVVPLLFSACVQAEATPKSTDTPIVVPVVVVPTIEPSPTVTPTPFPTPTPTPLEPEELLQKINNAMSALNSLHIEGAGTLGEDIGVGSAEAGLLTMQFDGSFEPGGDSQHSVSMTLKQGSSGVDLKFETRVVDGITYSRDPLSGDWTILEGEENNDFFDLETAITGGLSLENMVVSRVLSAAGEPAYQLVGVLPDEPESRVTLVVDAENLHILEWHKEGIFTDSASFPEFDSKPHTLDVRFSRFNVPFRVRVPELKSAVEKLWPKGPPPSDQTLNDPTLAEPLDVTECAGTGPRVCLVTVGPVPVSEIEDLAAYLMANYELQVTVLPPLSLAGRQRYEGELIDQNRSQLEGGGILRLLNELYKPISSTPDVSLIAVTSYDLFPRDLPTYRYVFAWKEEIVGGMSIVSVARLDQIPMGEDDETLIRPRLRKAVTRIIGTVHFGLGYNNDPQSIMRQGFNSPWALDRVSEFLPLDQLKDTADNADVIGGGRTWDSVGQGETGVFQLARGWWEYCGEIQYRKGDPVRLQMSLYTEDGIWVASDRGRGVSGSIGCTSFNVNGDSGDRFWLKVYTNSGTPWSATVRRSSTVTQPAVNELLPYNPQPKANPPEYVDESGVAYAGTKMDGTELFAVTSPEWSFCWELYQLPGKEPSDSPFLSFSALLEYESPKVGEWWIDQGQLKAGSGDCILVRGRQPGRYSIRVNDGLPDLGWRIFVKEASLAGR